MHPDFPTALRAAESRLQRAASKIPGIDYAEIDGAEICLIADHDDPERLDEATDEVERDLPAMLGRPGLALRLEPEEQKLHGSWRRVLTGEIGGWRVTVIPALTCADLDDDCRDDRRGWAS